MNADDELIAIFSAEVRELIGVLVEEIDGDPMSWDMPELKRIAHSFKGAARTVGAETIEAIAHILEEAFAALRDGYTISDSVIAHIRRGCALLETATDELEREFEDEVKAYQQSTAALFGPDPDQEEKTGSAASSHADDNLISKRRIQAAAGSAIPDSPTPAEKPQPGESARVAEEGTTLRVGGEKVDKLLGLASDYLAVVHSLRAHRRNVAGMLPLLQALRQRFPDAAKLAEFRELHQQTQRLSDDFRGTIRRHEQVTEEFQDGVRQLRMLRIATLKSVFSKAVRGMARTTGKKARFVVEGGETEVDRSVLDSLRDPLVHIIRNAVAHGLESPETREELGKPPVGTVTLRARSTGAWVTLEITDDGQGIDYDRIRKTAVSRGVLSNRQAAAASATDLKKVLFSHGFSTSNKVDEISGRGVGLDVAQRNLARLGGVVDIVGEAGVGTTVSMRLPLTRLSTKGIMVRLGSHDFLIPAANVRRTAFVTTDEIRNADGQDVVMVDDQPIPLLRLERMFGFSSDNELYRPIVVVRESGRTRAVLLDSVSGETDVVLQRLSWNLIKVPGISGAAVLDGDRVIPVLNAADLVGAASESLSTEGSSEGTHTSKRKRLLVVDDSITSRTLLKNILSSAGYEVEVAIDGIEALERLQEKPFDLVVSDVEMPRMDGFQLTEKVRADPKLKDIPLIICTSLGNEKEKSMGAKAGASAYVVKGTFDQDELLAMARRFC